AQLRRQPLGAAREEPGLLAGLGRDRGGLLLAEGGHARADLLIRDTPPCPLRRRDLHPDRLVLVFHVEDGVPDTQERHHLALLLRHPHRLADEGAVIARRETVEDLRAGILYHVGDELRRR